VQVWMISSLNLLNLIGSYKYCSSGISLSALASIIEEASKVEDLEALLEILPEIERNFILLKANMDEHINHGRRSTSRMILVAIVSEWGDEAFPVKDGAQALSVLQTDDAPRLLLLDWDMPKINGLALCKKIRLILFY
jgi:CheY-like chemotaxis protein